MTIIITQDLMKLKKGDIREYSDAKAHLLIEAGVAEVYEKPSVAKKEFKEVEETKEFKPKQKKTK